MRISLFLPLVLSVTVSAQDSLNVRKLFHWDDPTIPAGTTDFQNQYNDVWGYAADGREYAFLGSSLGVHVFDVTDPVNTVLIDQVPGRFSGVGVTHRDYKVFGHHLFATCDQGASSLQVMDLQYLPDSLHVVYDSDSLLVRAHNIQIDTVGERLYTCGGSTQFSVYDISDPSSPSLLSNCEADIPWWGEVVGYVHDCFVRDNIVWCNDGDGMHVIDFTDAENPVILGSLTSYAGQGYNHSGWMNDQGTLYTMADETHGSPLKFVDATQLDDLEVISTVTSAVHPTSILHNPFFTGDLVHVAYYYDGYWLWNLADPTQPILIGYYDTSTEANTNSYRGAWGTYPFLPSGHVLVSDMQTGLWVLNIDQATSAESAAAAPAFRVSPTLTPGPVTVTNLSGSGPSQIDVFDASGSRVIDAITHDASHQLDVNDLRDGMYIVRVTSGRSAHTQRIVITGRP